MKNIAITAVAVAAVAGGAWFLTRSNAADPASIGAALAQEVAADDVNESLIVEMFQGNPDAAVEVIEYASFTCPHCRSFHEVQYPEIKANYIDTGLIKFTYREVYFDRPGLWASMVARCGGEMRFFGIVDLIYERQGEWARRESGAEIAEDLRQIGKIAGLTDEELDVCMTDAEMATSLVGWYQANAEADDVTGTPSFVINGEKYSNMSYAEFAVVLDEKLAEADANQ